MATIPETIDRAGGALATHPALWRERVAPALFAAVLGAALLYGVGFSSTVQLHNAAHDSRHSAAFPCH
jgi:cobalt transporter subunit CbtB